jgi:hypothetical protein
MKHASYICKTSVSKKRIICGTSVTTRCYDDRTTGFYNQTAYMIEEMLPTSSCIDYTPLSTWHVLAFEALADS